MYPGCCNVNTKSKSGKFSKLLLGNESWELFEGIPKNFPLRTRVRIKYSTFGYWWEAIQTFFAVLVSALYVMQTYDAGVRTDDFDQSIICSILIAVKTGPRDPFDFLKWHHLRMINAVVLY